MTDRVRVDPERQAEWVAALRSGKFDQGSGYLKTVSSSDPLDGEHVELCCLGVLCEVAGIESSNIGSSSVQYFDCYETDEPPRARQWLARVTGLDYEFDDLRVRLATRVHKYPSPRSESSLTTMTDMLEDLNDSGYTFNEIADFIELHGLVIS